MSGRGRLGREGTRPGALFRGGGVAAPGPAALATGGQRSGAGGEWPFAPTAGSSVTVCDREVGDDRDPSEKGLPTAQKAPFMVTALGFLVCPGENARGGGRRDSGGWRRSGGIFPLLKWR